MSTDTSFATRSREENWLPVLELAVEEVFEIMVGCRVKPVAQFEHTPNEEFTAMIGLAGALCEMCIRDRNWKRGVRIHQQW